MERILIKLLSFLLMTFIASIIIFKQYNFNIAHMINFALISVFFILMLIKKERAYKVNAVIIMYAIFIIIALASSLWGVSFNNPSFKALQLFLILINMFIIYNIISKYQLFDAFLDGILIGALVNYFILLQIIQVPFEIYIGKGLGARAIGTMGNPNILTTAMLISMIISMIYLFRKQKITKAFYYYQFINMLLAMYIILLTVSKKGMILGVLLFISFLMLSFRTKKGRSKIVVLIGLSVIIGQFFIDLTALNNVMEYAGRRFETFFAGLSSGGVSAGSSTEIRKQLVEFGLTVFQDNPLIGHGLDNFREISTGQYAHNTPIELLVGVGFLGTIVYYSMHVFVIKKIYNMEKGELKYLLYFFVISILLMDLTTVSYGIKLIMFSLLYISILAEYERKQPVRHVA